MEITSLSNRGYKRCYRQRDGGEGGGNPRRSKRTQPEGKPQRDSTHIRHLKRTTIRRILILGQPDRRRRNIRQILLDLIDDYLRIG